MKTNKISTKTPVLTATEVAKRYGFNEHYKFVEFIWEFSELNKDLLEADWLQLDHRKYLPHQIEIIERHFGKPKHKSIGATELAKIYGYSRYSYFKSKVLDDKYGQKLLNELFKYNWDESYRKIIPIWIDIFVKYLGEAPGLNKYLIDNPEKPQT